MPISSAWQQCIGAPVKPAGDTAPGVHTKQVERNQATSSGVADHITGLVAY